MRHGVTALLHKHLRDAHLPDTVRDTLRKTTLADTRWNLFLTAELHKLMEVFQSEAIAALPFKGVTLASAVYRDLALRAGGDLDLLLLRDDARRARDILLRRGYKAEHQLGVQQDESYLRYHYAYVLSHPETGVVVELHWNITPRYFSVELETAALLKRACKGSLDEKPIPIMAPEDLLLLLCVHGAKHCWNRLIWVCDIAELLASQPSIDWVFMLNQAEQLGARRMLFLGLALARELGALLPDPVLQMVNREVAAHKSLAQWRSRLQKFPLENGMSYRTLFHLRCRERWSDRLRYVIRLATTVTVEDWTMIALPKSLSFFYVLFRVPRLFRKYVPQTADRK